MESSFSHADCYQQYIQKYCRHQNPDNLSHIYENLENTSWDTPTSPLDWNNIAVIAMIEAQECGDNLDMRSIYLEMAFEALNNGFELNTHPLCDAHLALAYSMVGEAAKAMQIAISTFINTLLPAFSSNFNIPTGLIYLPLSQRSSDKYSNLGLILQSDTGYYQALLLLSEVLCRSQTVFYNITATRLLHMAAQLLPNSSFIKLRIGISVLISGQWEGLLHLHQAQYLAPDYAPVYQALYLAYRDFQEMELADYWFERSQEISRQNPNSLDWYWTKSTENSFTYVTFEDSLIMAVEPSLRSFATSVLVAEGRWFEKEMEFWRSWIKSGMTVVDVGANVGVYTFSAAQQVGSKGRVLAVEPFSRCVRCLQETREINQLSWVTICTGAVSDRNGTLKLLLHSANELNKVVSDDTAANMPGCSFEEVTCYTLDSLIEQENLETIDFLKIDAEGHEIAVLKGSSHILTQLQPVILYENIDAGRGSNIQVAEYLCNLGYKLFRYRPYKQELVPVDPAKDFQQQLNLIAISPSKISTFGLNDSF